MKLEKLFNTSLFDLSVFDAGDVTHAQAHGNYNTNLTTDSGMTAEMKVYYDNNLIRLAGANLVHDQFAQIRNIPKNGGKVIEFRKYDSFPKALTPLTEGVTPDGRKMNVSVITKQIKQYGDYVTISDMLELTAIDNNILEAQELLADQAGRTLDTITREVMNGGTNVLYAGGKSARGSLANPTGSTSGDILTVKDIKNAVRILKGANTKKINGYYVAIIHPDVEYDITNDPEWVDASEYAGSSQIFEGEIGKIYGVKFVETTEAKIFEGEGASDANVYSTMVLGANYYGTTSVNGGGLQTIVKQKGSAGSADPLDQRSTVGWKAIKTAVRLVDQYAVRIESVATYNYAPLTDYEDEWHVGGLQPDVFQHAS